MGFATPSSVTAWIHAAVPLMGLRQRFLGCSPGDRALLVEFLIGHDHSGAIAEIAQIEERAARIDVDRVVTDQLRVFGLAVGRFITLYSPELTLPKRAVVVDPALQWCTTAGLVSQSIVHVFN
jgi:hypothetical protein